MHKVKKKQLKISKIKRNNQKQNKLSKRGKSTTARRKNHGNKSVKAGANEKTVNKHIQDHAHDQDEMSSDQDQDLLDMIEKNDLEFLNSAITQKSYDILRKIKFPENTISNTENQKKNIKSDRFGGVKRKSDIDTNDLALENKYEADLEELKRNNNDDKRIKLLLPIKTKEGILKECVLEKNSSDDIDNNDNNDHDHDDDSELCSNNEEMDVNANESSSSMESIVNNDKLSTIELVAYREQVLKSRKLKIGILSSSLLENPHVQSNNLKILLNFMDESNPEVCITVKKLTIVSLLEVFKDLLPSYRINDAEEGEKDNFVKYKKETLELKNYEKLLLSSYKNYLKKLEKIAEKLRKKKGRKIVGDNVKELGRVAVFSMCQLLVTHTYFNYSMNIVNFLIPLLNNRDKEIRTQIFQCFSQIFVDDKRGEISLTIVRKIYHYVKEHLHSISPEFITVLYHLKIKDVNIDDIKCEQVEQKKLINHKQRVLALSKREKKKNKKLEEIEREMLETKAVENKMKKKKIFTEITNIVFTIYFKILKEPPNKNLLSLCLRGLSKFAACINIEYYQDLVIVINSLMQNNDSLGQTEQLDCINTVFTILSGQASALSLDPHIFYIHLYKQLVNVHAGETQNNCLTVIDILMKALIDRRKRISQRRLIAFIKRITNIALQMQHHGTLGILSVIKLIMKIDKRTDILLDTDNNSGNGFYQAELDDPEYSNADCTALWELVALQRHYHSVVQKFANYIACSNYSSSSNGEKTLPFDITKLSPQELFQNYDPGENSFTPAVPVPVKKLNTRKYIQKYNFHNCDFEEYIEQQKKCRNSSIPGLINFYKASHNCE